MKLIKAIKVVSLDSSKLSESLNSSKSSIIVPIFLSFLNIIKGVPYRFVVVMYSMQFTLCTSFRDLYKADPLIHDRELFKKRHRCMFQKIKCRKVSIISKAFNRIYLQNRMNSLEDFTFFSVMFKDMITKFFYNIVIFIHRYFITAGQMI